MRAMSSAFCSRIKSISVRNFFRVICHTICMWAACNSRCSSVGGMRTISVVRGGQLLHHAEPRVRRNRTGFKFCRSWSRFR